MKRILIKEGTEIPQEYQDYEVHVLSNKSLYNGGPDNMKFGNVRDLHKKYNYDILLTGDDPYLEKLKVIGKNYNNIQVLESQDVESIEEAIEFENKKRDMKFVSRRVVYRYEVRGDAPPLKGHSRDFCVNLVNLSNSGERWTKEEIQSGIGEMNNGMPGDVSDAFKYRGGYYNVPGTSKINKGCRHKWVAELIIVED